MKSSNVKIWVLLGVLGATFAQAQAPVIGPGPHDGQPPMPGYAGLFFCNQNTINFFQDSQNASQGILMLPPAVDVRDPDYAKYVSAPPYVVRMVSLMYSPADRSYTLTDKNDPTFQFLVSKPDSDHTGIVANGSLTQTYEVFDKSGLSFQPETIQVDCNVRLPAPTGFSTGNQRRP